MNRYEKALKTIECNLVIDERNEDTTEFELISIVYEEECTTLFELIDNYKTLLDAFEFLENETNNDNNCIWINSYIKDVANKILSSESEQNDNYS